MQFYSIAEGVYEVLAGSYIKKGEVARVSMPLEVYGSHFREIKFTKSSLGGLKTTGCLYISDSGEKVYDEETKRKIAYMAYKGETILDDAALENIKKTMTSEEDLAKDRDNYEHMIVALDILKSEGSKGYEEIAPILSKLPDFKVENNRALQAVYDRVTSLKAEVITRDIIDEVNSLYQESLMINFRRIKLMAEGIDHYENIKAGAARKTRFAYLGFSKGISGGFLKLQQGMEYIKKVLTMYESVRDLAEEEYKEFLAEIQEDRVEERMELSRD